MAPPPAQTSRRVQLLDAAADLFAAKGYHAVGIDDIGAAAGISGPGVYRHFAGKQALLAALCATATDRMLAGAEQVVAGAPDPHAALVGLVDLHVAFAVRERALLGVWAREQRALADDVRRALRRPERAYEQVWREVVGRLRDDLEPADVAVVVRTTLALLNSTGLVEGGVAPERLTVLLRRMALAALLADDAG